ncbi:hypothetical protein LOC67_11805 [Stieleria sp. JC731]|uniref:acyltransferase n=1 Tax=Pirellulaceae TaxID=2691357 RepID=UPI001E3C22E8|nr:hypothetical protein [Stieleria sp. JC731]MCC9601232.1 hypothetical protein [Stieleria sp. JC731]
MMGAISNILRGLRLLRHPELIKDLGNRYQHLQLVSQIAAVSPRSRISSDIILNQFRPDGLRLGDAVSIGEGSVLSFGDHENGLGTIQIGSHTWIGPYNNFRSGGGVIEIGVNCLISQFCSLVASHHGVEKKQLIREQSPQIQKRNVRLGSDVWLGAGVTITAGSNIGDGVVVGAGSVVLGDIPQHEIWAGTPARKIGERK